MRFVTIGLMTLSLLLPVGFTLAQHPAISPAMLAPYRVPSAVAAAEPGDDAVVTLGKTLFFDPILSHSGSTSCATCHNPGLSWGAGLPRAIGDDGAAMALRAPTLIDLPPLERFGWDGKFPTVESVTFAAISGAANMNLATDEALDRLRHNPGYVRLFGGLFPTEGITQDSVEQAIGAFERTIVERNAPFDRFVAGETDALSPSARAGFALFTGRAHCAQCHGGWAFTDGSFHDIGSATGADVGRGALFPTSKKLRYAFKTPTLRDVARRGPFMHDGSIATLREVVALYERGGIDRPSRSELIKKLSLSEEDRNDLIAFLESLTDAPAPFEVPALPR